MDTALARDVPRDLRGAPAGGRHAPLDGGRRMEIPFAVLLAPMLGAASPSISRADIRALSEP